MKGVEEARTKLEHEIERLKLQQAQQVHFEIIIIFYFCYIYCFVNRVQHQTLLATN